MATRHSTAVARVYHNPDIQKKFIASYEALSSLLFTNMSDDMNNYEKLERWKKMHDPRSIGIIFRFPPKPLGLLMHAKCPLSLSDKDAIQNIPETLNMKNMSSQHQEIVNKVNSMKTLRKLGGAKICRNFNNCSLCDNWDWENYQLQNNQNNRTKKGIRKFNKHNSATFYDILMILTSYYDQVIQEARTEEIRLQILNKEISSGYGEAGMPEIIPKEVVEAEEKLSMEALIKEREEIARKRELEEKQAQALKVKDQRLAKKQEYNLFIRREDELKAAIIITEAARIIADDLMNNHGIQFKLFIEELLNKQNKVVRFRLGDNSLVLANQKEKKEVDPIEEALVRIGKAKTRRDKRKILEQYSLVDKQWGEFEKYHIRRKVVRDRNQQANKVYDFKIGGYIDKGDYDRLLQEFKKEDKLIKQGIPVKGPYMSRYRRRTSLNVYENTEKFEVDVNLDKRKRREIMRVEKSLKKGNQVEIAQQALNTLPYMDKEEQMFEIMELYKKKVEFDEGVNKRLFETLGDDKYSKPTKHDLPTSDDVLDYLMGWDSSERNMVLAEPRPTRGQKVTREIVKVKGKKDFTLSRTSTGFTDNEISRRHRISKIKKIEKQRDSWQSVGLMLQSQKNMENILHEKDGVISKMRQFDYKIHKQKKKDKIKTQKEGIIEYNN
ncbi:unnamed protein product [Moneuplotes crassus]|uniref:Uncharacterized protein n=1 Tax=Euplotes crassus TaxID=5936 RepID=A0AAD1U604_EUPCR|nr:unnamed protein product [Moneuplotes crassus]